MTGSALYTLIQLVRFLVPTAATLAFLATEGLFVGFMGWYYLVPMATVPCVFFWAIHRPGFMPLVAAVLIGLAEGAIFYSPLGLAVIPLVLTVALVEFAGRSLRHTGFMLQWATVSGLIIAKVVLFMGFEMALNTETSLAWLFYLNKLVVSVVLYPVTHLILSWINFALGDN